MTPRASARGVSSAGWTIVRGFFVWITARPIPALVAAAVLALTVGAFIFQLERDVSPDAFIPSDHPALILKEEVDTAFSITQPIAIGVITRDGDTIYHPETLELIRQLTLSVQSLAGVDPDEVVSIFTESGVYFDDGAPGFERLVSDIPADAAGMVDLERTILSYELYRGTLVAADGSAATILIRSFDEEQTDGLYRRLIRRLESPEVTERIRRGERLVVAGDPAVRAHMGAAVSDDALRMNFICPVVMALLIVLAYRTGRGTLLPLAVIGGASALALGSMGAAGVPVYIVTNGIFVVIMALGVADSLHLLGQYYEEQLRPNGRSRQQLVVDASMALWYPLLITTLTDFTGFFALYLVGRMPPIRTFGLFTCVGVLGALLYSYVVVPAGLMLLPVRMSKAFQGRPTARADAWRLNRLSSTLGSLGVLTYRRWRAMLAVGLGVILTAAWGASHLVVNDARILSFKGDHPIVQASNALNQHFDGTFDMNIVLEGSEPQIMLQPEILARIDSLEVFTESLPYVGGTHSLAGWVKRAHQKMNEDDPAYFAIPDDASDTQFYLDVLRDERTSPMAHFLREIVDPSYTNSNLIVRMKTSEYIHQREIVEATQQYVDRHFGDGSSDAGEVRDLRARVSGRAHLDYHWLKMITTTHINSVILSLACVLLLTGLMFRSAVAGLLCALTVAVAVLVNYAIMGLGGIPLGVGTSMFASIAIGAGVNFPIHILDRLRRGLRSKDREPADVFGETLAITGRALFFTAFVVAVGFLLLCVSEFRTLVRFGLLIGVGMLVSFLVSVTLLPAIVAATHPAFAWGNEKAKADDRLLEEVSR